MNDDDDVDELTATYFKYQDEIDSDVDKLTATYFKYKDEIDEWDRKQWAIDRKFHDEYEREDDEMAIWPFKAKVPARKASKHVEPSPIERQFWAAYARVRPRALDGLTQQYRVGRYRIDFAVPRQRFGIELDGFQSHSNTESIARDCHRQRVLQASGWVIVRFGGREVFLNPDQCVREAAALANVWRKK